MKAGVWYAPNVEWAAQNGIVNGTGGGKFSPGKSVTREQMAVILYNYAKFTNCDLTVRAGLLEQFPDGNKVGRMRTLAFQVEEELFQRVKQYLERNGMTQRQFVIGLIEDELDRDEELLKKQQEDAEQSEEEQDEGLSEDGEATVSEDGPDVEQVDEPEETAAVGDSEGSSDEPNEEESEQDFTNDEPDYSEPEDAEGPVEDGPDESQELDDEDLVISEPAREFVEGELGAAVEVAPTHEFDEDAHLDFPEPDNEEDQDYGMDMGM